MIESILEFVEDEVGLASLRHECWSFMLACCVLLRPVLTRSGVIALDMAERAPHGPDGREDVAELRAVLWGEIDELERQAPEAPQAYALRAVLSLFEPLPYTDDIVDVLVPFVRFAGAAVPCEGQQVRIARNVFGARINLSGFSAAQSDVAPDGAPSLAPPGAPSSAPRVNAGIGPAPESDEGDDKNGQ